MAFYKDVRIPSGNGWKYQKYQQYKRYHTPPPKKQAWGGHRESKLYNAGLALQLANTLRRLRNTNTGLAIVTTYKDTGLALLKTSANSSIITTVTRMSLPLRRLLNVIVAPAKDVGIMT